MAAPRATNFELQKWIARQHGFVVESAWIDRYRQLFGNARPLDEVSGDVAIPPEKLIAIRQAFRHFGM